MTDDDARFDQLLTEIDENILAALRASLDETEGLRRVLAVSSAAPVYTDVTAVRTLSGAFGEATAADAASVQPTKWSRRFQPILAAAAVLLAIAAPVGAVWFAAPEFMFGPSEQGTSVHEFDLVLDPGYAYDLDVPPGRLTKVSVTDGGTPQYHRADLYRTMTHADQLSGWDAPGGIEGVNPVWSVPVNAGISACRERPPSFSDGFVDLEGASIGTRVCLRTHENRPVLLTITRLPKTDDDSSLTVHVIQGS
jgi:hypothetical protein